MNNEATQQFIEAHRNDDVRTLALQQARYPDVDIRYAVTQIEGWQAAKSKLPSWAATEGIIFPPRISMEQCSSEATALYKASLARGNSMADLTGGFGIDCSYMARNFKKATYIERNELLCNIARHNFALLGLNHINIINGNSEQTTDSLPAQDWIFVDPARRDDAGKKVVQLADCEPDVTKLEEKLLNKSKHTMIKCSPMLDITAARRALSHISEVHIIAVNNECKELLFILGRTSDGCVTHCINLHNGATEAFTFSDDTPCTDYSDRPMKFLYEPNAAIQKAGCHGAVCKKFNLHKLHPNSHLYTSQYAVENFPGRVFRIADHGTFAKSDLKRLLHNVEKANITVRNFPDTVQTLRKRLKIADGGDIYLFATTLADNSKILIRCHK